MLPNKPLLMLQ